MTSRLTNEWLGRMGMITRQKGWLLAVLLAAASAVTAQSSATRKPRIAVMDFDYTPVEAATTELFGRDVDVGKGLTNLVAAKLVEDRTYSLIDRETLDAVAVEQSFSPANRKDVGEAVRIGKLLGVDVIVVGSVTEFGSEPKKSGGKLGGLGLGMLKRAKSNAGVEIDARLVNVGTGETLAATVAKGTSLLPASSLLDNGSWNGVVDFGSSEFEQTILGEATKAAVDKLTTSIVVGAEKIAVRTVAAEGLVAAVDGAAIVLNVGTKNGLKAGDRLEVRRISKEVQDPATGAVIRRLSTAVGVVKATEVDEASAVCVAVSGKDFKVGDVVKVVTQ